MRFAIALALCATLAACGISGLAEEEQGVPDTQDEPAAAPPDGAIRVGEDLYMVPIGVDARGCAQFTAWSATMATAAVVQYRRPDGSFTMNVEEAQCG